MKQLESLEIVVRRTSKPRQMWGPFHSAAEARHADLPFGTRASWQIVTKANGGYGKNHETGATIMSNFKGLLEQDHLYWTISTGLGRYEVKE